MSFSSRVDMISEGFSSLLNWMCGIGWGLGEIYAGKRGQLPTPGTNAARCAKTVDPGCLSNLTTLATDRKFPGGPATGKPGTTIGNSDTPDRMSKNGHIRLRNASRMGGKESLYSMRLLIIRTTIQYGATPLYPHELISNLLLRSMDFSPTT